MTQRENILKLPHFTKINLYTCITMQNFVRVQILYNCTNKIYSKGCSFILESFIFPSSLFWTPYVKELALSSFHGGAIDSIKSISQVLFDNLI